jgi:hypothetical protein
MAIKSTQRIGPAGLLFFAVSAILGLRLLSAADLPTSPGVGFSIVGFSAGQTARLNALNTGPGGPVSPTGVTPGSCGGGVTFEFYSIDGELLKSKVINNLLPGKAAFVDLKYDDLPKGSARTEIRAVLRFGYAAATPPGPERAKLFECNLFPSLEVFDNATGRTSLILTDAKLLPAPNPPRH